MKTITNDPFITSPAINTLCNLKFLKENNNYLFFCSSMFLVIATNIFKFSDVMINFSNLGYVRIFYLLRNIVLYSVAFACMTRTEK